MNHESASHVRLNRTPQPDTPTGNNRTDPRPHLATPVVVVLARTATPVADVMSKRLPVIARVMCRHGLDWDRAHPDDLRRAQLATGH